MENIVSLRRLFGIFSFLLFCVGVMTLVSLPLVSSLHLIANQSDYYFTVGEQAVIPLYAENFSSPVSGTIQYTISQQSSQGGSSISNTNTQSMPFTIANTYLPISLGSSSSPTTLLLSFQFDYTEQNQGVHLVMPQLTVHFVSDPQQEQSQQNKQESSEKTDAQQQQDQQQAQQQAQQQLNKEMQQQKTQQQLGQRLLSNQMNENTAGIKQEMQDQFAREQAQRDQLAKTLSQQPLFQKINKEMQDQGYQPSGANIDPQGNTSGSFQIAYNKSDGSSAILQGNLKNNTLSSLSSDSPPLLQDYLAKLAANQTFLKEENALRSENLQRTNASIEYTLNSTKVFLNYTSSQNQSAQILAIFINQSLISLAVNRQHSFWPWQFFFILFILVAALLFYFRWKRNVSSSASPLPASPEPAFDYHQSAEKMLAEAKTLYDLGKGKEAYGKAGASLRLFLSHKYQLRKEVTNTEIIRLLRKQKIELKEIDECLGLCSLVQFAKYSPDDKDFSRILELARAIFKRG